MKSPPAKMSLPTRDAATSETQLVVNWAALTGDSTGGDVIDSYHLQWDSNTNGVAWTDLKGQDGFEDTTLTFT